MGKILSIGFLVLIGISLVSTYYTHDMEQQETEKGQSISQEISQIKNSVSETESAIPDIEKKKSETESFILEEQRKQQETQNQIEDLNQEKEGLQQELDEYRKMAKRDPRVLITVDDPVVRAKVAEVTRLCRTTEERQQAIFEYVRKEIEYVTEGNPKKWSYPQSFLAFKFDFWQLPRETIEWRKGDCEDVSILLCAMMRAAGVPTSDVKVVVGTVEDMFGHAWIEFKKGDTWYALESTCPTCNYIEKSYYYEILSPVVVFGWFNDTDYYVEELPETESTFTAVGSFPFYMAPSRILQVNTAKRCIFLI